MGNAKGAWTSKQERKELLGPLSSKKTQGKNGISLGGGYVGSGEARTDCGQEEQQGYTTAVGFHFGVFQEHRSGQKEMD